MKHDLLEAMVRNTREDRTNALAKPPSITCLGNWIRSVNGDDYDCDYAHAGKFGCENCIINGGAMDPRTGKRFARRRGTP